MPLVAEAVHEDHDVRQILIVVDDEAAFADEGQFFKPTLPYATKER
jgi:hypothetical protein